MFCLGALIVKKLLNKMGFVQGTTTVLCVVYIIPQHSTLLAYGNLNEPLRLPFLIDTEIIVIYINAP